MSTDFTTASADDLLKALEEAGRTPGRALLEACLDRRDDLVPGLLAMLEAGGQQGYGEEWDRDDPRWYRDIHAALLLIAFREEKALPLFADIFRDQDREVLWDWIGVPFVHYGPPAVDMLIGLVKDRNADGWTRTGAAERLKDIALLHPETRDRVVEVLRARLPRVDDAGRFVVPPPDDEEHVRLWTFVACDLAELKDTASRHRGVALYEAGLIDETVMGNRDAYLAIFDEDIRVPEPFDLVEKYHPSPETAARREAAYEELVEELDASFLALSIDDLLHTLAHAGPTPDPGLIRTCIKRRGAVTPGLLALLAHYHDDQDWDTGDPRWYAAIHAGRLLIAFREEKALPLFEQVLCAQEEGFALDWFESELPYYGPAALPMLMRLLRDASVPTVTRTSGAMMLKDVAHLHPDVKPQVVDALRAMLPPLSDRGEPVGTDDVDEDRIAVFTFVALALARLGDTASQAQVEALHDWYLIDESVYGDADDFRGLLQAGDDPFAPSPEFDLEGAYMRAYLAARREQENAPVEDPSEDPFEDEDEAPWTVPGYGGRATYVRVEPRVGRNDPCPCGSGKKYKKCCGRR